MLMVVAWITWFSVYGLISFVALMLVGFGTGVHNLTLVLTLTIKLTTDYVNLTCTCIN